MVEKNWKELDRLPNHSTRGLCLSGCCIDNFFFFWYAIKDVYIRQKKRAHMMYGMGLRNGQATKESTKKKNSPSLSFTEQVPNQSTRLIKGIDPFLMYVLTHAKRLLRNKYFNFWSDISLFLNLCWFFSFHNIQKMHRKEAFQNFFHFFSYKWVIST